MDCPDLGTFWSENEQRIGEALPGGVQELAKVLRAGAESFGLVQEVEGPYVHWTNKEGKLVLVFCVIGDPRDLDAVLDVYQWVERKRPMLAAIFVHQWTDGEGNWDVFAIGPHHVVCHCDRIDGSNTVQERGPKLRDDLYTLFARGQPFPEPGQDEWADLLAGPIEGVFAQLDALAEQHGCTQTIDADAARWLDSEDKTQAMFVILPDPADLGRFIRIHEQIRQTASPVTFVFVKCDSPRWYDIFRLSARSYLEHHNQVKGRLRLKTGGSGKMLDGLRWVPRWASHVGCIKGCLNYLGIEVSDAWLFGATGHAFVLNISPGLCPSGPTDWDTSGFLRLGRNLGYVVERVDEYCPKKDQHLRDAQERAWDHVQRSIDEGLPCYGWEIDIPEYFVIYGYDETGYYISGPECDEGAGPVPWQNLGTSPIGQVLVASVRRTEPASVCKTVRDALAYAVDLGHNRRKWTDRAGGLAGYDVWIDAMEQGKAGRFGLGYTAAVWAESRKYAVEFLTEAAGRLGDGPRPLFETAVTHYEVVARSLRAVSDACPFKECSDKRVPVDDRARTAAAALKQARDAEAAGLDVLAELVEQLST